MKPVLAAALLFGACGDDGPTTRAAPCESEPTASRVLELSLSLEHPPIARPEAP